MGSTHSKGVRIFKEISPTDDNSLYITGYIGDEENPTTYKIKLDYIFAIAMRRVKEVNKAILGLSEIKTGAPQYASVVDEIVETIQQDDRVVKLESKFFNMYLKGSLDEALGPVLSWALASAIVISTSTFAGARLISALRK